MTRSPRKLGARIWGTACIVLGSSLLAIGCGSDDSGDETTATASSDADLTAIKDYLTQHADELDEQVGLLQENAQQYYDLAESVDFDYDALMQEHGDEVNQLLSDSKDVFVVANPAYEEMEGVVAGVPRLAQYDVDIDAGSDASDPESAVSFSLETPDGQTLKQPGNLFFLTETALYRTNPDLLADVEQDVDGDGKVGVKRGSPTPRRLHSRRSASSRNYKTSR